MEYNAITRQWCLSAVCIGQTGQSLRERINGHTFHIKMAMFRNQWEGVSVSCWAADLKSQHFTTKALQRETPVGNWICQEIWFYPFLNCSEQRRSLSYLTMLGCNCVQPERPHYCLWLLIQVIIVLISRLWLHRQISQSTSPGPQASGCIILSKGVSGLNPPV